MCCLAARWVGPKRYLLCDFCMVYYDILDRELVLIGEVKKIQQQYMEILQQHKEILQQQNEQLKEQADEQNKT